MQVPIVIPKKGMKGLKMGPIGNNDWIGFPVTNEEKRMASDIASGIVGGQAWLNLRVKAGPCSGFPRLMTATNRAPAHALPNRWSIIWI